MEEDTFQCKVQLCDFPALDEVQVGERVPKQEWSHWDPEVARRKSRVPIPASSSSDSESMEGNIDSDSEYGLESLISAENSDSDSLYWEDISLPEDFADLRSQLLTPRGMSLSPINIPNLHVPSDYIPATPIYSPTSPDYSPSMSPITVESDSSDTIAPSTSSSGIITTRDCDMFEMYNTDSDQDLEGEAETMSLVGAYLNRGKLPVKIHGVFIFPQPVYVHNLTWNEHPFEHCANHCVMPEKSDKSFAKFYLTHSLCTKHRSSLTNMGPWIYLTNRVTTLPKLHKSPQICHFINLLHGKIKGDQRVRDYLVVCQLVDTLGNFTLIVRVDLFLTNNPLELKSFTQTYYLNDHVDFGDKMQFYVGKDFMEKIYEFHVGN